MNIEFDGLPLVITVTPRQELRNRTPATATELLRACLVDIKTFSLPSSSVIHPYQAAQLLFSDDAHTRIVHQSNSQLFSEICSHLASTPVYNSIQTHALLHLATMPTHNNGSFAGSSSPSRLPIVSSQSPYLLVTHHTSHLFNLSFITDFPISLPLTNFAIAKVDPKSSSEDPPLQCVKKKPRRYKPTDKKIHTVPATLPEEYCIHRNIIGDGHKQITPFFFAILSISWLGPITR
jgi:hypothetical protein